MTDACCVGNYDLCIQQGATFERVFTWIATTCNAVGAAPQPVDLTGCSAQMQIRPYAGSPTLLYDASMDIALGGANGTITLIINASDTESFDWFEGVYDLLIIDGAGNVRRLLSGNVSVCEGVTVPVLSQYVLLPGGQAALVPGGEGILTP